MNSGARLKRRSEVFKTPLGIETPSALPEEESFINDDINERKARQRIQKRNSLVGTCETWSPLSAIETPIRLNNAQLTEHYTNCIKLSTENKINTKNAFKLQLIDYMAELMKKKEIDNFQVASCALDASAKIYAYRVDSIHTDTLKLAGGVGNVETETGNSELESIQNEDEDSLKNKKSIKKRNRNTVEKNIKNINVPKFDLEFDVDPLFKKTTAQYDSGGGGGSNYFLNTLLLRDDCCELIWDSGATLTYENNQENCQKDEEELSLIPPSLPENVLICPQFATFNFKKWSLDEDDELNDSLSLFKASQNNEIFNQENEKIDDDNVFDIMAPLVEIPEEDFDDAENALDEYEYEDEIKVGLSKKFLGNEVKILEPENIREHLTMIPLEYSYFNHSDFRHWAGPKHWKFKNAPSKQESLTRSSELQSKRKRKKEDALLDYSQMCVETIDKSMSFPLRTTKLHHKTMVNWTDDKRTLPTDSLYKTSTLIKLEFLDYSITRTVSKKEVDESVCDYNFNNDDDTDNFCPDLQNDDYNEQHPTHFLGSQDELPTNTLSMFDGDEYLVDAPNAVQQIHIAYAKKAKLIDMKRLKNISWTLLYKSDEEDKENKLKSNTAMRENKKFSELYRDLRASKAMPFKMVENLSVPIAFVALLHLCNERSLSLEGQENLSDLLICQP